MTSSGKSLRRWLVPLALLASCAGLSAATAKPNILFFLVDDMGWQETSVPMGPETTQLNRSYRTPNMDRLAKDGMIFTNAYACAICSPTRISLMTGQNAARHRVTCWTLLKDTPPGDRKDLAKALAPPAWNLNGLQPIGTNLPNSVEARTLPQILRENGYKTIHVGKAHFGTKDTPGADPLKLGFDVNIAGSYMGGPGSYYGEKNFSAAWREPGNHVWDIPGLDKYHGQEINLTEAITREAITELEKTVKEDKKPFYLYMAEYAVHAPYEADTRFKPHYDGENWSGQQKTLASMLESMDKSLGDLMAKLDELGVADNTIIVFMSDNGSPQQNPRNLPLRGFKISAFEGGSRVPMIVHYPGKTKGTSRTESPVIIEDIFPTFLQWAGVKDIPENDGMSFSEIIDKPSIDRSRRPLFWHYPNMYDQPPFSSVRLGDLKLIYWHSNREFSLFDLKNDLAENTNLAKQRPDEVSRLAKLLASHLRETHATMPTDKSTGKPVPLPDAIQ